VGQFRMVNRGKVVLEGNKLSSDSVIVVGIVRDIGKTIKRDIEKIGKSLSFFREVHWFLVESGSSDNSKEILQGLSNENMNLNYISIGEFSDSEEMRTENMATARNQYLSYLRKENRMKNYSYVIIADFNLLNKKISRESILSSWERTDWDVVTANQSGRYYDIWALRHPLWSPNDCWEHHAFLRRYVKLPEKAVTYSMRSRMLNIPKNSEWIRVESAFGGLAIYRPQILQPESLYIGKTPDGHRICEHVPFHKSLADMGARIYVNPSMINTRYTDHSLRLSYFSTILRILSYPKKVFDSLIHRNLS
jgi:hypothetical protein